MTHHQYRVPAFVSQINYIRGKPVVASWNVSCFQFSGYFSHYVKILFRCFLELNNFLVLFITDPLQDGPELVHDTFTRLERDGHVLSWIRQMFERRRTHSCHLCPWAGCSQDGRSTHPRTICGILIAYVYILRQLEGLSLGGGGGGGIKASFLNCSVLQFWFVIAVRSMQSAF